MVAPTLDPNVVVAADPLVGMAFDSDGRGWSIVSAYTAGQQEWDATHRVAVGDVYENIAARLNGQVVGYACSIGGRGSSRFTSYCYGYARTAADGPALPFLPTTKIPVASVSKFVTALAAIRVLGKHGIGLDEPIGGYLPNDWDLDEPVAQMTFRQLLSHRSHIKDYGNTPQDYESLKRFFTQRVDPTKSTPCQGPSVVNPPDPINVNDDSVCYSNYNFSIFRVLLPMIDGFVDNPVNRARNLADAYVWMVQKYVFEPVGVCCVEPRPPTGGPQAHAYAFSYKYPGDAPGHAWDDSTLAAGAAGWWLAIEDINKVLDSLNKNDGRILTSDQLREMETTSLGWDSTRDSAGNRWLEKNGSWSAGDTVLTTSVGLFGPGLYGALFVNSDIAGGPGRTHGGRWCNKCQELAVIDTAAPSVCPKGGQHDHGGSGQYWLATRDSGAAGQENWRACLKCQALTFAGNPSQGLCPGGGEHAHADANYVLAQTNDDGWADERQGDWKYCRNCKALFFRGSAHTDGECEAGGVHDPRESGDYFLQQSPSADGVLHGAFVKALRPV